MPKVKRTPPPSPSTGQLGKTQSVSDSDIPSGIVDTNLNITTRHKRPRVSGSPSVVTSPSNVSLTNFKTELLAMLEDWKAEQKHTLSQLVAEVAQLKVQCSNIQATNNEIEKSITYLNKECEDIFLKVSQLEQYRANDQEIINNLENRIQDLQLKSRSSSIEIRGAPAKTDEKTEDLLQIIEKLGKTIQLTSSDLTSHIRDTYRLPSRPGNTRSIFVEFTTVQLKNKFLGAVRVYNRGRKVEDKLNTEIIGLSGDRKPIYVEEHLSRTSKRLFHTTRNFAKKNNFQFCWISNGRILLRKNGNTKDIYTIKTEQCLEDILCKQ